MPTVPPSSVACVTSIHAGALFAETFAVVIVDDVLGHVADDTALPVEAPAIVLHAQAADDLEQELVVAALIDARSDQPIGVLARDLLHHGESVRRWCGRHRLRRIVGDAVARHVAARAAIRRHRRAGAVVVDAVVAGERARVAAGGRLVVGARARVAPEARAESITRVRADLRAVGAAPRARTRPLLSRRARLAGRVIAAREAVAPVGHARR